MDHKQGRPNSSRFLHVRVKETEYEQLKGEADRYGFELSSFVRLRIFGNLGVTRVVRRPPVDMRRLGDALGLLGQNTSQLNKIGSNLNQIAKRLNQGISRPADHF